MCAMATNDIQPDLSNEPRAAHACLRRRRNRRGQELMEMLVGAVAITGLVAWSVASTKMADAIAIGASSLPGSHPGDNGSMESASFMELELNDPSGIKLDSNALLGNLGTNRFGDAMGDTNISSSITPGPSIHE